MRLQTLACFRATLAALLLSIPLTAGAEIFLFVEGVTQGVILGGSTQAQHANWIITDSFSHGISVPIGPGGTPSGPPRTSELSLIKPYDRASAKLFKAASTLEEFIQFRLEFTRLGQGGVVQTYYRIRLDNARLSSYQQSGSGCCEPYESASFIYTKITLEDITNGIITTYDWNSGASTTPDPLARGVIMLSPSPNPTKGETEFRFALPVASNAVLTLYDLRGRLVRELHHGWTNAEPMVAVWNGDDDRGARVAQGVYVAKLEFPGTVVTQRVSVVR